jgi:hypothetical protein
VIIATACHSDLCAAVYTLQIPAHPEYPSGHTFTVGAVLEVLQRTLNGKDNVSCGSFHTVNLVGCHCHCCDLLNGKDDVSCGRLVQAVTLGLLSGC